MCERLAGKRVLARAEHGENHLLVDFFLLVCRLVCRDVVFNRYVVPAFPSA